MYKIALINMPFAGLHIPSLGLTQLKAVLDKHLDKRIKVDILYINHDFANFFGIEMYRFLSDEGITTVTGLTDWIFRQVAFPELDDNTTEYFSRYGNSFRLSEEQSDHLLQKRTRLDQYFDELIEQYRLEDYSLLGFTSMFDQMAASFAMARKIKDRNPEIVTVIGGASCELSAGAVIAKRIEAIDFVFSGPALKSFPQFVQYYLQDDTARCQQIQGVYSKNNINQRTGKGCLELGEEIDINDRIKLDYDSFVESLAEKCPELKPELIFETSRGCWWGERSHCTFCGLNGTTMKYRTMLPQNAIAQFEELFDRYPTVPMFSAVDNILEPDYFETVFPYIKAPKHSEVFYETKLITNEEHMKILSNAGITMIQPGIEALSTSTLKLMKKGTTAFQNIRFLKLAVRYNIMPDWNLLIGFPNESAEVYKKYVEDIPALVHLPPPRATFPVRFDRYSPYYSKAEDYQLDLRPSDFYAIVYPFSQEEINDFAYFFIDHNYENQYMLNLTRWRKKVEASVEYWISRWNQRDEKLRPSLKIMGDSNVIFDSRSGDAAEYRLSPLAIRILKDLQEPVDISHLIRRFGEDEKEFEAQVEILKNYKLVFQEDNRMLSLLN